MSQRAPTARRTSADDDPVARAIEAAPFDDEPESPEEARAVAHAREQVKRGEVLTDDDLRALARLPPGADLDAIVFEGTAEEAIRFLEGEHAEETIAALRAEGLLCDSSG